MKILAIDSSSQQRSVCLCEGSAGELDSVKVLAGAEAVSERGGRFASLVEEVLSVAGVVRQEVDALAVGVGPGSAAGIRSTLSFGLGWQMAQAIPLTGLSSVWALAVEARRSGVLGQIGVALPGPMGKVIHGGFQIEAQAVSETQPLQMSRAPLDEALQGRVAQWVGPDLESALSPFSETDDSRRSELRRVKLFPSGVALAELLVCECQEAVRSLEPEVLVMPKFVEAPAPRKIPDI